MSHLRNIINMLEFVDKDNEDENVAIAKGKYRYPYTIREIFQMKKRHLKFRKNGRRKNG